MTESVNVAALQIRPLTDDDLPLLDRFKCGDNADEQDMAEFLRDDALRLQKLQILATYLATDAERLVGFVSLLSDAVRLKSNERKKVKSSDERMTNDDHPVVPALKIARLAVSSEFQRQGIGEHLLRFALFTALDVSELTGCRMLTLDALPDRVDFYVKRGFVKNLDKEYKGNQRPSMRFDVFGENPPVWASQDQ